MNREWQRCFFPIIGMAAMLAGCGEKEAREQESAVEDLYEVDYAFTVDDFLKAASDG